MIRHTEIIGLSGKAYQVDRIVIGLMIGLASINGWLQIMVPLSVSALNNGIIAQSQTGKAKPLTMAAPIALQE